MKILVDADACPVKDIILSIGKKLNLRIIMFIDTSHMYCDGYSEVITVDTARDSVDFALANKVEPGDIVITQDYGVAAMTLAKRGLALNQNGLIYSDNNMNRLLLERHLSQKIRRSGGKTSNQKKRNKENDIAFERSFLNLCNS